jgi:hypothetical protein
MAKVQRRYVELIDRVEARRVDELPGAVDKLKAALLDPRIGESSLHSDDERFRELLAASIAGLDEFRRDVSIVPASDLLLLRGRISAQCESCHEVYKPAAPQ